jgi:hypothetical protein
MSIASYCTILAACLPIEPALESNYCDTFSPTYRAASACVPVMVETPCQAYDYTIRRKCSPGRAALLTNPCCGYNELWDEQLRECVRVRYVDDFLISHFNGDDLFGAGGGGFGGGGGGGGSDLPRSGDLFVNNFYQQIFNVNLTRDVTNMTIGRDIPGLTLTPTQFNNPTPAPIPLPTSAWLFLSAIAGLLWLSRKSHAA